MASRAGNVIPLPKAELPGLGVAATAALGVRQEGSRNEVWVCQAYDLHGDGVMLYIKPALSPRAMFTEILAAQLGQCFRLPCPDPYIVTVNPTHIGRPRGPKVLAFGSAQVGSNTARPIRDLDVAMEALNKFRLTETACAFDEWIANPVRGPNDILFDPIIGPVFIDHEAAMDPTLAASAQATNWLAARLLERCTHDDRPFVLKNLRARIAAAHRIQLSAAPSAVQYAQDGVAIYSALIDFIQQRLQHLDQLLSTRVLPEQGYLTETPLPSSHESDRATGI